MGGSVIEVRNAFFAYNGLSVLENVNLDVHVGDFIAMIGPNGGGKSTLLKLMLGLLIPHKGTVRVFGKPPRKVSHQIGYVPQDVHVNKRFPISVLDVVLMGKLKRGWGGARYSRKDRIAAHMALDKLEMGAFCGRRIDELSGGQLKRVFIARALATDPKLLFLDEPLASIDIKGQSKFYNHLKQLNKTITIVVVSHDMMALSIHVKSIACVNRCLHYHNNAEITDEILQTYRYPVNLITHGLPHRVLKKHEKNML